MPRTCILICTFERPQLLHKLLAALVDQVRGQACTVIVVDNGTSSSEDIVLAFRASMNIVYDRLSARGLVSARNRALTLGIARKPEFLVFIDDDEVPEASWLANLIARLEETGADFACGPVIPDYAEPPPRWAKQGEFFNASADSFRTSNLILRASCIPATESQWFRPEFNFSGGEDDEFLSRLAAGGAVHVEATTAVVRETIPQSRMRRRYIWRRGLRDGVAIAQIARLRNTSHAGFMAKVLWRACAKLGYGLNHLFWSPGTSWRLQSAIADFACAFGIITRALGVKFAFYGRVEAAARR